MSSYEMSILEAELLASPPERVCQWFESRAPQARRYLDDGLNLDIEKALLKRGDTLIDLALARFTAEEEIATELFNRAQKTEGNSPAWACRLAVLSNQIIGVGPGFRGFPAILFGRNNESVARWLAEATPNELFELFRNPTLGDDFLRDFLEGKETWKALNEDGRLTAVLSLSRNPRMREPYEVIMASGLAEVSHLAVFDAAWRLAETVPTTKIWANALWDLFGVLEADGGLLRDKPSLEVAKRWFPDPSDAEAVKDESSLHDCGSLGPFQTVRFHLARVALFRMSMSSDVGKNLLTSDDVALRAAAYYTLPLTPEQILAAYERDKVIGVEYAVRNESLWQFETTRRALEGISWRAVNEVADHDLAAHNHFRAVREKMEKKHPKWFVNEEFGQDIPATKADIQKVVEEVKERPNELATKADVHNIVVEQVREAADGLATKADIQKVAEAINLSIEGLSKTLGWVCFFSLGAFAAILLRHC